VLQVDDEEINPFPDEPFRLIPADAPRVLRWGSRKRYAYLRAEHAGYRRLRSGVLHRRSILLDASKGAFHIEDWLMGEGHHDLRLSFHLAPGWSVTTEEAGWTSRSQKGDLLLQFLWRRRPETFLTRVEEDLHSPSYGRIQEARTVRIEWEARVPCRIRYDLLVRELSEAP